MVNKWSLGVPIFFTVVLYLYAVVPSWLAAGPTSVWQNVSPFPRSELVASPLPTEVIPCEVFSIDELIESTGSHYLPPRVSANQRIDGLLIQRCLWLSVDEKLTPTISLSITSAETASASAITEYWQKYIDQNQVNRRFRTVENLSGQPVLVDSWGTHLLLPRAIVTIQASMPSPADNQHVEWQLLNLSWRRLSEFYSSTQSGDVTEGQSE